MPPWPVQGYHLTQTSGCQHRARLTALLQTGARLQVEHLLEKQQKILDKDFNECTHLANFGVKKPRAGAQVLLE